MLIGANSIEKRSQNCVDVAEVGEVLFRNTQPVKQDGVGARFDVIQNALNVLDYLGSIGRAGEDLFSSLSRST
jgi:hypothetical protein